MHLVYIVRLALNLGKTRNLFVIGRFAQDEAMVDVPSEE